MRIGIFSDAYLPVINGVVTSIETLRKGLIKQGHEVFIISNHGKLYDLEYKDNVLLLPGFKLKFLFDNKLSNPIQTRAQEIIKQMNLDIIHVQTEFGVGLFARLIARKENIPLVYTYHTTWEDYTHYINPLHFKPVEKIARKMVAVLSKELSKPAQAIITPSSKTKQLLEEYGVYQPIHVIPTGVDLSRFKSSPELIQQATEIRNQYQIDEDDILLLFVGRLGEEKNLELVIRAVEKINNPKLKFMIVGGGPILNDLRELVKNLNLENRVVLTDKVPNDQIAAYYLGADAFISASMTETQGLTFIEAMASGCPLFASDREVLSDLLYEGENGYFFETEEECVEKLNKFLSLSKEEQERFKNNSLEFVKPYSDDVFVNSVYNLYQRVLNISDQEYVVTKEKDGLVEFSNELNFIRMAFDDKLIADHELSVNRIVSVKEMSELREHDILQNKMNKCLTRLTYRDYSIYQMREYLKSLEPEHKEIDEEILKQLQNRGFLNDERFIYELLERYQERGYGIYRIERNLEKYKFDEDLVEIVLEIAESHQSEDLQQAFEKAINNPLKGSLRSVKRKLSDKLIRQGFNASDVTKLVGGYEFDYDESDSCIIDYQKLSKNETDPMKIRQKLQRRGYQLDSIRKAMELENE